MSTACRQAFSEQLLTEARTNPRIVVLCSDSRGSVTLDDFARQLPEQFIEVGIAEQNAVGLAAGLANAGLLPFIAGPACFYSMRSAEQVKVDLAYSKSNVKLVGISGGVSYGALGSSHHSLQDIAAFSAIANLNVLLPADAWQTRQLTTYLVGHIGPVYMRMGRGAVPDVYGPGSLTGLEPKCRPGQAISLCQGKDVLLIGVGETVHLVWQAAQVLAGQGIMATVLDLVSAKPLDRQAILRAAALCRAVITVEEHHVNGGIGDQVAGLLTENLPRRQKKIAFPDEDLVTGSSAEVFRHYGLTVDNIVASTRQMIESQPTSGC